MVYYFFFFHLLPDAGRMPALPAGNACPLLVAAPVAVNLRAAFFLLLIVLSKHIYCWLSTTNCCDVPAPGGGCFGYMLLKSTTARLPLHALSNGKLCRSREALRYFEEIFATLTLVTSQRCIKTKQCLNRGNRV